jgi:hypothetical protein
MVAPQCPDGRLRDGTVAEVSELEGASGAPGPTVAVPGPGGVDDARRLQRIGLEMAGVEAALRRLDEGSYHLCEECGRPLEAAALEADPLTTRCRDHHR